MTGSSLLAFDADNVHPAATPAPGFIDLSTVAHSVVTVPHQLEELQRAIVVSCAALAVIGLVNAVLLVCLLMGRRRERTAQPIAESSATVSAGIAAVKTPEPRTCGCGTIISLRSRSGRCRQCANEHRRGRTESLRSERAFP